MQYHIFCIINLFHKGSEIKERVFGSLYYNNISTKQRIALYYNNISTKQRIASGSLHRSIVILRLRIENVESRVA